MEIIKLELKNDYMSSNCYILRNKSDAVVIDPGFDDEKLYTYLIKNNLNLTKIILTHGHYDHWTGLEKLLNFFPNTLVYASSLDQYFFNKNPFTSYIPKIDVDLNDTKTIDLLGYQFQILKTPGHSNGSLSFYYDKMLFSGDVLFYRSIGRYDLYGGSYDTLLKSIRKLLQTLPLDTTVHSGHGRPTTLAFEMKNNPFLK